MNKNEYLDRLSKLLADISYEEHEEALSYYREYIEDAGIENEQRVIEELGTPEHLAQEIREGLLKKGEPSRRQGEPISAPELRSDGNNGTYGGPCNENPANDNSYSHYNNYQQSGNAYNQDNDNRTSKNRQEKSRSTVILIIIALIATSPIWFSVACTIIGAVFACIVSIIAIALGIGAVGIACIVAGIALVIAGISACLSITAFSVPGPLAGAALIGAGLIVSAAGILFMILTIWLFGQGIPALVRFIRQTVSRVSQRRKESHI